MTGDQIILDALLLNGVIYAGQTISPEVEATSLQGLNYMLGEWNAQGLAIFAIVRTTYPLQLGTVDYTIGPGGLLNGPRPEKIDAWAVHSAGSGSDSGKPMDAETFSAGRAALEAQAWSMGLLPAGNLAGLRVKLLNYDAAYPLGTIHVYPAPGFGLTLDLWVWEQLAQITDATLQLDFPPGYLKAITYNLAVDLAPKFGREVSATVKGIADACKAGLGSTNADQHSPAKAPQAA